MKEPQRDLGNRREHAAKKTLSRRESLGRPAFRDKICTWWRRTSISTCRSRSQPIRQARSSGEAVGTRCEQHDRARLRQRRSDGESEKTYPFRLPSAVIASEHVRIAALKARLVASLGGDHSISFPAVEGLVGALRERTPDRKIGHLHIDSHGDFTDEWKHLGRFSHASVLIAAVTAQPGEEAARRSVYLTGLEDSKQD